MKRNLFYIFIVAIFGAPAQAQTTIKGTIRGESALPFVNVYLKELKKGVISDADGQYILTNIPDGQHTLVVSYVGYNNYIKTLQIAGQKEMLLDISLESSITSLNEVVVTGTNYQSDKRELPFQVNTINKKDLEAIGAQGLSDGLSYSSGLRLETNCQTCGYSQLRINGMGGGYSQILINGKSIFNGLLGLYGLEIIPASIVDEIEILKGGGSALYGSNAVAGSVNVITRKPTENSVGATMQGRLINNQSVDASFNANVGISGERVGAVAYINQRDRQSYDHNGDGFSEIPRIKGNGLGINTFYNLNNHNKFKASFNSFNEHRRGGNKLNKAPHNTDQAEDRFHDILTGIIEYEHLFPASRSNMNLYAAGQLTDRIHYTGVDGADAYGNTKSKTLNTGAKFNHFAPNHTISAGADILIDYINDTIPLYNYGIDQQTNQFGIYMQDEYRWDKYTLLAGARTDYHNKVHNIIFNPRFSLKRNLGQFSNVKLSYSHGYRAPQAFDTDMHIAFAGGGVSIVKLDPNLTKESSRSVTASFNYDEPDDHKILGFTVDFFYTLLKDAFVLTEYGQDDKGNIIFMKKNGPSSYFLGTNIEMKANFDNSVEFDLGYTIQQARYNEELAWSDNVNARKEYLRTPGQYGYYFIKYQYNKALWLDINGTYTGKMFVPHLASKENLSKDALFESPIFLDVNCMVNYKINWPGTSSTIKFFAGIKNIFNNYQSQFDKGRYRDSNFIYGPSLPRTILIGATVNN